MSNSRTASSVAIFTFGLAALGGALVAVAAPASAESGSAKTADGASASHGSASTRGKSGRPHESSASAGRTGRPGSSPTTKVGSKPTAGINSTGGAMTSGVRSMPNLTMPPAASIPPGLLASASSAAEPAAADNAEAEMARRKELLLSTPVSTSEADDWAKLDPMLATFTESHDVLNEVVVVFMMLAQNTGRQAEELSDSLQEAIRLSKEEQRNAEQADLTADQMAAKEALGSQPAQ